MFIQRALVTLILGPLALYLVFLGGWFFFLPVTAVLLVATAEYLNIVQKIGWQASRWLLFFVVLLQLILAQWPTLGLASADLFPPVTLVSFLLIMTYALWLYERRKSSTTIADWFSMMGGMMLIGWIGGHLLRIQNLESMAWQWTMLALVATWTADTGAYLVGRFLTNRVLGRHQLTPRLSPNKTVEGYFGGVAFSIIVSLLAANILQLPLGVAALIATAVSLLGPLGDLSMSMLKRQAGVKDSGVLFPGHGGALDRVDSLIWSVAIAYYLIVWIG
ncbi:MAG: phosphatidate cytidylyltransferase [Chloroflexota bacterium]